MGGNLIMIHGTWMDGSVWQNVAPKLRDHGLDVFTPTLAGHGPEGGQPVTYAQMAQTVIDLIEGDDLSNVWLFGHGMGGAVAQKVAEAMGDRINRVMFVNGFVLQDGESMNDHLSQVFKAQLETLAQASSEGTVSLPYALFREIFANDATADLAKTMYEDLSPTHLDIFAEQIALPDFADLPCARSYIHCREDTVLPHGDATGWYPKFGNRLGLIRFAEMQGSHMALRTRPDDLFNAILQVGRD